MRLVEQARESYYRFTGRTELAEVLRQERATREFLQESLADLEARMLEPGWQRLTSLADREFTRDGLRQITSVVRVMALKSPLIKRGLALRQAYVWGEGVEITARDDDVNKVIHEFLDDSSNRRTFSGAQAREQLERALGTDGNVFFACFTSPATGRVQVRTLPWDEITDVITNPEDDSEPWYYRRAWWTDVRDLKSGAIIQKRGIVYYPALGYTPRVKLPSIYDAVSGGENIPVMWDAPVCHVKVGGLLGWKWGVGDAYAAVDWAQAYKEFLTDWATLVKSLSRFAWRLTAKGSKQAAARVRMSTQPSRDHVTGEPNLAGATASLPPDMAFEAIPKSGATIDSESGRPLAAMVAAALDVPVTMLLGDPGTVGARATAQTLDTPTERAMQLRRAVWTEGLQAILAHVILSAVKAPKGALSGTVTYDAAAGRETVKLADDVPATVDISWPDLDDVDIATRVEAIVKADGTTLLPPLVVVRLLLETLGVTDVDEILQALQDDQGRFLRPDGGGGGAGQAAVDAFNRGEDPAALFANPDAAPGNEPAQSGKQPAAA